MDSETGSSDGADVQADSGTLEQALERHQELLTRLQELKLEYAEKRDESGPSRGLALLNRVLLFGTPIGAAAATYVTMDSILWALGAAVLGFVGIAVLLLIIFPSPAAQQPGTQAFNATQEIGIIIRYVGQEISGVDTSDLQSVQRSNRALEHYLGEFEQRLPKISSSEQGPNSISVTPYNED